MNEFASFHPLALFLYFMSVFAIAIVTLQPVMVLIFLICTTLFYIRTYSMEVFIKSTPYKLVILCILALSNPLFVHQGVTILGYLNGNPITLEAILYGVNFAFMMFGIWNLCACYQKIMDSEKFIYLFGCMLPSFALIVSMALRLIPKFKKQLLDINDTQKLLETSNIHPSYIAKVRNMASVLSILITWAFETSIVSADSMKARGYGVHRRKNFHNYHFGKRDIVFMSISFVMSMIILIAYQFEFQLFYFYPHVVSISYDLLSIIGYGSYILYLLMPLGIQGWEERKWKSSISRI